MKTLKSVLLLFLFTLVFTSCNDLEIEDDPQLNMENIDPALTGDDDTDDGSSGKG
ncbi:MAG: hypothetical protein P8K77_05385 [Polaribacter sp.]|nr:hypothetical protein [Polaribacter sp.]